MRVGSVFWGKYNKFTSLNCITVLMRRKDGKIKKSVYYQYKYSTYLSDQPPF